VGTIPDQLYDRLANARITCADGAALIELLDCIDIGAWSLMAD
jgi:hypothetical protein